MTVSLLISILLLALIQGIVVGLLPGLPGVIGIIVLLPLFEHWPIEAVLLFFACYMCVTQYFGSVSALLFKVPGESSSIPVLEVALKLKNFASVVKTYRVTALTSLVGGLVGVTMFVVLFVIFRTNWAYLFSTKYVVLFLSLLIMSMLVQNKKYVANLVMSLLGLGFAYFSELPVLNSICDSVDVLCFLRTPAESTLVLLSLYCVPVLFSKTNAINKSSQYTTYVPTWWSLRNFYKIGLKHGLLGFFVGFTPGAGVTLASNLSNNIEQKNNPNHLLRQAGAAEAGNNAAAISCTIPFLFLGLPITASEIVIDNFLSGQFYRLNLSTLDTNIVLANTEIAFTVLLVVSLLIINVISFLLCSHFIRFWQRLLAVDVKIYVLAIKILIVSSLMMIAVASQIPIGAVVFTVALFGAIGVWAEKHSISVIPLAIMISIGPFAVNKFVLAYNLYLM